ncbi:Gfo/Idh/MocA family oxidoreductase [bacterium]|nr:Gfo/Idh/MocA family oxidoreductase [bacterium]
MEEVRVGVVGVGHHGGQHVRIYRELPGVVLAAVVDTDAERLTRLSEEWGVASYSDYRDIASEVDAVSIATPTISHHEIAEHFLSSGKHVFLEKPMASTVEEAEDLIRQAGLNKRVLQIGHVERFNPAIKALMGLLRDPGFIECHRLSRFNPRGCDVGVVLDLMIHDIDIILTLVNDSIKSISAVGVNVLSDSEDIANARIEFEKGCIANLTASRVSLDSMRKIRIFQRDAYISLDYGKQEGLIYRKVEGEIVRSPVPTEKAEPLKLELESFIRSIRSSSRPPVSAEQGKWALEIAMEIVRDIRARNTAV